ncbi:MAG: tyrosine-type recombinase/integrase [Candidatus Omnitrophica bacterium]|nr:tyrosine-type recombinase/integrase [Candidatus Omnitrophota bacterium]
MKQQHKHSEFTLKTSEIDKIVYKAISFRDRCILKSLYWIGLRREELTLLDIQDIDFERKRVIIHGKGKKIRVVPIINNDLLSDLKYQIGNRGGGPVFSGPSGENLTPRAINYVVSRAGERASINNPNPALKHINPHIFRHSIARHLKDKGFSAEWVQKFLGHSSFKTTMDMYGTLSLEQMQEEASRRLMLE